MARTLTPDDVNAIGAHLMAALTPRLDRHDEQLARIVDRLDGHDAQLTQIVGRFDRLEARLDRQDKALHDLSARVSRIEERLEQLVKNTLVGGTRTAESYAALEQRVERLEAALKAAGIEI